MACASEDGAQVGGAITLLSVPLSEADTHAKLVNPAIYARGWTEDHIKREETTGAVDLIAGKARRRAVERGGQSDGSGAGP